MNVSSRDSKASLGELGNLLRYWRDVRGVSQLELSLEAGISQRQISFVESGRSVPGRETLLTLAQALEKPRAHRRSVVFMIGDERRRYAIVREKFLRHPCIFGKDRVGGGERRQCAKRYVAQIADRRCHDMEA